MRRTHALVGLCCGLALTQLHPEPLVSTIVLAAVTEIAALLPDMDIRLGLKHRGVTHSLLALALVSLLAWSVDARLGLTVAVGYGSHLALDSLTVWGIPLLYPFQNRFRLATIRTGGKIDALISVGACCAVAGGLFLIVRGG